MITYNHSLVFLKQHSVTQSVLLIGTSSKGLVKSPVYVYNPIQAESMFGEGQLVDAYKRAYDTGGRSLYLMRLSDNEDISVQEYIELLLSCFNILIDLPFVFIYPVGLPIDQINDISVILDFAYSREIIGLGSHWLFEVSVQQDNFLDYLLNWQNLHPEVFCSANSYCLSIIASQTIYEGELVNAAATYVGLISANASNVNLTLKNTLLDSLAPTFNMVVCEKLSSLGFVVFYPTVRHGIAVYRANTAAVNSDLYQLYNYRTTLEVVSRINSISRDYLGLFAGAAVNGYKIENAVSKILNDAISEELISNARFKLNYEAGASKAVVDLLLVPYWTVDNIKVQTIIYIV